ncbi:MAG TPA: hypothetical protein VMW56_16330 [Candidatus Margulisiibacteriota bacterium]|nr:hypothetical protein [Candidatus Margulisiibacteriota bacterium]
MAVASAVLVTVRDAVGVGVGEVALVRVRVAVATGVVEPRHVPLLQRSLVVHVFPSSHGWPSLMGCLLMVHWPVSGLHCAVEHASLHDTGWV